MSPAGAGGSPGCDREIERNRYGTWTTTAWPTTPRGPVEVDQLPLGKDVVRSYAVDPNDASTIYVADDWTVMRSTDGGCTWAKSFSVLDEGGISPETDQIVSLTAAATSPTETRVYALMRHGGTPFASDQPSLSVARLAVLDGTGRWSVRDPALAGTGAPLVGEAEKLWVRPGAPGVMYMRVNDFTNLGSDAGKSTYVPGLALYASEDAGITWELRGARGSVMDPRRITPAAPCATSEICSVDYMALAVDPLEPNVLWSATYAGVVKSTDGGRSWRDAYSTSWSVVTIDIHHSPGGSARIAVLGLRNAAWSFDGGVTWRSVDLMVDRIPAASASGHAAEVIYTDNDGRAHVARPSGGRDVSLPSHGEPTEADTEYTRLRDVTYVPDARSYFFLGANWWDGKSLVMFTPRARAGDRL
jgi:hypothetical protein